MNILPKDLSKKLNVTTETLRLWESQGKLQAVRTKGGHRRYVYNQTNPTKLNYCYARVSSKKQENDLNRQIEFLKSKYPDYELVSDIGSGINFKRKGLLKILEQTMSGNVKEIVVTYRDRLCRFGFELFQYIFQRFNTKLTVINDTTTNETDELTEDLMSIITVFTARYYGKRNYQLDNTETEDIS